MTHFLFITFATIALGFPVQSWSTPIYILKCPDETLSLSLFEARTLYLQSRPVGNYDWLDQTEIQARLQKTFPSNNSHLSNPQFTYSSEPTIIPESEIVVHPRSECAVYVGGEITKNSFVVDPAFWNTLSIIDQNILLVENFILKMQDLETPASLYQRLLASVLTLDFYFTFNEQERLRLHFQAGLRSYFFNGFTVDTTQTIKWHDQNRIAEAVLLPGYTVLVEGSRVKQRAEKLYIKPDGSITYFKFDGALKIIRNRLYLTITTPQNYKFDRFSEHSVFVDLNKNHFVKTAFITSPQLLRTENFVVTMGTRIPAGLDKPVTLLTFFDNQTIQFASNLNGTVRFNNKDLRLSEGSSLQFEYNGNPIHWLTDEKIPMVIEGRTRLVTGDMTVDKQGRFICGIAAEGFHVKALGRSLQSGEMFCIQ